MQYWSADLYMWTHQSIIITQRVLYFHHLHGYFVEILSDAQLVLDFFFFKHISFFIPAGGEPWMSISRFGGTGLWRNWKIQILDRWPTPRTKCMRSLSLVSAAVVVVMVSVSHSWTSYMAMWEIFVYQFYSKSMLDESEIIPSLLQRISILQIRKCKKLMLELFAADIGVPAFHSRFLKDMECLDYSSKRKRKSKDLHALLWFCISFLIYPLILHYVPIFWWIFFFSPDRWQWQFQEEFHSKDSKDVLSTDKPSIGAVIREACNIIRIMTCSCLCSSRIKKNFWWKSCFSDLFFFYDFFMCPEVLRCALCVGLLNGSKPLKLARWFWVQVFLRAPGVAVFLR